MAYSFSDTIEALPTPIQKLARDPVWWAFLGSLGVHGIIFAVMPFISLPTPLSDEADIQREVSVIELEPEDLSRVPDFSESQIEIPAIPNEEYFDDFYSFDSDMPDDAIDDFNADLPPLTPSPPLDFSWPSLPPPPPITFNPVPPAPAPPIPSPSVPSPSVPSPAPAEPPVDEAPPTPAEQLTPDSPQEPPVALDNPPDAPPQTPPAESPDAPPAEESVTERLLAEQAQLQEMFTFSAEGTTQDDANIAFGTWFYDGLGKNLEELQQAELTPPFPAIACPVWRGNDITAVYGTTVGTDGVPADDPVLIQSSGYEFFNQQALEAIQQAEIPNESGEEQAFLLTVRFAYDEAACPINAPEEEVIGQDTGG